MHTADHLCLSFDTTILFQHSVQPLSHPHQPNISCYPSRDVIASGKVRILLTSQITYEITGVISLYEENILPNKPSYLVPLLRLRIHKMYSCKHPCPAFLALVLIRVKTPYPDQSIPKGKWIHPYEITCFPLHQEGIIFEHTYRRREQQNDLKMLYPA